MRKIILSFAILLMVSGAYAAGHKVMRIAVLDFGAKEPVTDVEADFLLEVARSTSGRSGISRSTVGSQYLVGLASSWAHSMSSSAKRDSPQPEIIRARAQATKEITALTATGFPLLLGSL